MWRPCLAGDGAPKIWKQTACDDLLYWQCRILLHRLQILVLFVLGTEDDCQILPCTQDTRGMMLTEDDDVEVGTASCSQTRCTSMSYCEYCVTILISYCWLPRRLRNFRTILHLAARCWYHFNPGADSLCRASHAPRPSRIFVKEAYDSPFAEDEGCNRWWVTWSKMCSM